MKKQLFAILAFLLASYVPLTAQSFGDEDDLFGGDDDTVDEWEASDTSSSTTGATSDLRHGVLFEDGSVKVGGKLTSKLATSTVIVSDDENSFGDNLKDTTLTPTLTSLLSVDARPTQTLRIYTKFGMSVPFTTTATTTTTGTTYLGSTYYSSSTTVSDWLSMEECFTDFSAGDRVYFRFGLHTVSWGTGYFFSPVSDIINTSSIDPENPDDTVSGALNLRTQITFPGTQNCIWLYVIPSTDFASGSTNYARDTGLAAKGEILLGDWELGAGGYYRYADSPKVMLTATGSLLNIGIFGEAVYQYGSSAQWTSNPDDWSNKENVFKLTAGINRYWSTPKITLAAQYYYDSEKDDYEKNVSKAATYINLLAASGTYSYKKALTSIALLEYQNFMAGHNMAALLNFGRVFGTTDVTASVYGILHIGTLPDSMDSVLEQANVSTDVLDFALASASLAYSPIDEFTVSAGPYLTWTSFNDYPTVSFNISATLGGGSF